MSGFAKGDRGRLLSGPLKPTEDDGFCFSFWYHMYGSQIGELNLYLKTGLGEELVRKENYSSIFERQKNPPRTFGSCFYLSGPAWCPRSLNTSMIKRFWYKVVPQTKKSFSVILTKFRVYDTMSGMMRYWEGIWFWRKQKKCGKCKSLHDNSTKLTASAAAKSLVGRFESEKEGLKLHFSFPSEKPDEIARFLFLFFSYKARL